MSKELTKKAVELLLRGATLVSDPCPYCKGVRIMKDGNAFCVNCGHEATNDNVNIESLEKSEKNKSPILENLEEKLEDLTDQLKSEKDYEKQQQILVSINEIIAIKEKLKKL